MKIGLLKEKFCGIRYIWCAIFVKLNKRQKLFLFHGKNSIVKSSFNGKTISCLCIIKQCSWLNFSIWLLITVKTGQRYKYIWCTNSNSIQSKSKNRFHRFLAFLKENVDKKFCLSFHIVLFFQKNQISGIRSFFEVYSDVAAFSPYYALCNSKKVSHDRKIAIRSSFTCIITT